MAKRSVRSSPRLFISYRRDDTGGDAGRLNDTLNQLLGPNRTFFDLDQIAPGMDFEVQLERALSASEVLLALIGPKWETVSDSSGKPRLSDKKDLVRIELLAALKSKKVRIVPILLNRDTVPKKGDLPNVLRPITRLNAFPIRRDRWREDVAALLKGLGVPQQQTSQANTDSNANRQSRFVSASVEWKRKNDPDPTPRRWVVYVDNDSDAPIAVEQVKVSSPSIELSIEDWGTVRPKCPSDYELEESDFDPSGDRPEVYVRFLDSYGQRWTLRGGVLKRISGTR
jgi:TIR domain-containing protein